MHTAPEFHVEHDATGNHAPRRRPPPPGLARGDVSAIAEALALSDWHVSEVAHGLRTGSPELVKALEDRRAWRAAEPKPAP
jgi:hypothetical protein